MSIFRTSLVFATLLAPAGLLAADAKVPILSETDLSSAWVPAPDAPRVVAGYPSAAKDKTLDVCVNLGFSIKADGATTDFTQLKVWSSGSPKREPSPEKVQAYVQMAAATVSLWRFKPVGEAQPAFSSASFAFNGSKSDTPELIRDKCRIPDLKAFVAAAAKSEKQRRGTGDMRRLENQSNFENGVTTSTTSRAAQFDRGDH